MVSDDEATKILFDLGSGSIKSCGNGVCFAPTILRPLDAHEMGHNMEYHLQFQYLVLNICFEY